jgi:hypothetical protein
VTAIVRILARAGLMLKGTPNDKVKSDSEKLKVAVHRNP